MTELFASLETWTLGFDHYLTALIAMPLVFALIMLFTPRQNINTIRWFSIISMGAVFLFSLLLLTLDFSTAGYHLFEEVPWIDLGQADAANNIPYAIHYRLGIDGISLWLVLLTTLLTPIALFASWLSVKTKIKEFAIAFLLLEAAMIGTFLSLDLFLFYVFWELMLVPMYLIVGIWGGPERVYASVKFFIYTMIGSLLMLVAILYLVATYKGLVGYYSFDLHELLRVAFPGDIQWWLFGAFALAFAIKVPMFPFHTWLPDAHVQAPVGGSVILAAVMLKLGTYGFIRFAIPLFPLAAHELGPTFAGFAVAGIIYGALCAWVQKDVKKLVAYSSVSHLGFVMLGIFSMTGAGVTGAVMQMVNHGISTGALFILVGVIYDRRHTRNLDEFGGLAKAMPVYATMFVIVAMSSIGLPGTNGFIGEFMVLAGTYASEELNPWGKVQVVLAATGVVLAAIYMLHATRKMFFGPVDNKANAEVSDMNGYERAVLAPLIVLIFFIGFFPNHFTSRVQPSVDHVIQFAKEKSGRSLPLQEPDLFEMVQYLAPDARPELDPQLNPEPEEATALLVPAGGEQ